MRYYRPSNVMEAVEAKKADAAAVFLAGGTQVNRAPLDRGRPESVIDIREALDGRILRQGTDVVIGAMATLQEIADSQDVPEVLRQASGFIPTRSVRNVATIGGNIAAGRPDSYLIPILIALTGQVRTTEGSFFIEDYVRDSRRDLILDVYVPVPVGPCIVVKESRSHVSLPVVSAAVSLIMGEDSSAGTPSGACVAVGCVSDRVIRLTGVEEGIVNGSLAGRRDIEAAVRREISPRSDILGSAGYKSYINAVRVADAVVRALEELT